MSKSRLALVAAAAAAAVALSACSTNAEPKPWPTAGAAASSVKPTRWISIPDVPVQAAEQDTAHRLRFGTTPAPGMGIYELGTDAGCTLGPLVSPNMAPDRRGYLTSGHCDTPKVTQVVTFADAGHNEPRPVGVYTGTVAKGYEDFTSLWLANDPAPEPTTIAGHPVAGLLTRDAVKKLNEGTAVCVDGAVSGVKCGTLSEAEGDRIQVEVATDHGDSGGTVFLVDGDAGTVTVIGQVQKSSAKFTYATFFERALDHAGAKLVVDPDTAADPGADPRYSSEFVKAS
ncbi:trypsin domain-containing protein [Mycobacteroides abscessus subsp. massiliense]|uniref:hypothetical protein n=1 Tax=Mycobacteroides abscessus TaxID=36809 RepID=UPI00092AE834|nr:hypothetical protein [Mycobacteroides abscessus]SHR64039.1 trypsin domain-containing protein [Mycobacteroides abscessus subsp. abscessus]SKG48231.1 trypsin domain-containing protein [Mycobacteroides abscessus subsp. massiliense]SKG99701.1 trypsin domain-containing protein [Mycobacteroides abscessus subsp. massiliense]SKH98208.1 trypsin domain-containing protein [Mycobacteroides abscessus subsp. massiliense]SKJ28094.1 trypsin domain-containing protein [Mycobacteroides abscessus subsp. massil